MIIREQIENCTFIVDITNARFHSAKPDLRFYVGSNPACGVTEVWEGKNL